jgi:hypothetical protein
MLCATAVDVASSALRIRGLECFICLTVEEA